MFLNLPEVSVNALLPLAVVAAQVLVDGGFELKEVVLYRCSDGALNNPGNTNDITIHNNFFM